MLPYGKVLVAGGNGSGLVQSAELYDPASGPNGTWTATGSLIDARSNHTATLLADGRALVTAGAGGTGYLTSAELYDSANGSWTGTGNLALARDFHSATLLPSGKVLVAGGQISAANATDSAERYDPSTGTWTTAGTMTSRACSTHSHVAA